MQYQVNRADGERVRVIEPYAHAHRQRVAYSKKHGGHRTQHRAHLLRAQHAPVGVAVNVKKTPEDITTGPVGADILDASKPFFQKTVEPRITFALSGIVRHRHAAGEIVNEEGHQREDAHRQADTPVFAKQQDEYPEQK